MAFSKECQLLMERMFLEDAGPREENVLPSQRAQSNCKTMSLTDPSFGKEYRLLSKADFLSLKVGPQVVQDQLLRVLYKKSPCQKCTRIGLAVSRKVGNAVTRNKARRILREEFRLSSFKQLGIDTLVIIKTGKIVKEIQSRKIFFANLKRSLYYCFKKIEEKSYARGYYGK